MELILHPDAASNFSNRADQLLLNLTPRPESRATAASTFLPDIFVSATIQTEDVIGETEIGAVDAYGREVARYFRHEGKHIGLRNDNWKKLVDIAEGLQRTTALSRHLSVSALTDHIWGWLKARHSSQTDLPLWEYIRPICEQSIQEFEVWIPIARLYIQSELPFGRIVLKTITSEMIDDWQTESQKPFPAESEGSEHIQANFTKERKSLQGLAAATITITADPRRAFEIALEETEQTIALLRFYSPANFLPELHSLCTVLGKEHIQSTKHLLMRDGKLFRISTSVLSKSISEWRITNEMIRTFRTGLEPLSKLLGKTARTEFEEVLLNSLILFSRHSLEKDLSDKLLYINVALETILLRNETEPIQQNVRERMAFISRTDVEDRKSVIRNYNAVYSLRSRFIHHGHTVEDLDRVRTFMHNAWDVFFQLINNISRFQSKEELINAIEETKLV